ncbi:MAG: polysaccharide deacetylase family protein [Desulfotomaculum sp.]|nr:polysaccharide deacetylase family protein [Desulfotomaculum sp.]
MLNNIEKRCKGWLIIRNITAFLAAVITVTLVFAAVTAADTITHKRVLITFDDGPDPRYTPAILDVLAEHNIKAVFFVTGKACQEHPQIVKRIVKEGHVLGNHTYSHFIIKGAKPSLIIKEVTMTDNIIKKLTGKSTNYFRPPTGEIDKEAYDVLKDLGMKVLMWDLGLEKKAIKSAHKMVEHLVGRIGWRRNLVILMHDGSPHGRYSREKTVEALPVLITELKNQGFSFINPSSLEGKEFINKRSKENIKTLVID